MENRQIVKLEIIMDKKYILDNNNRDSLKSFIYRMKSLRETYDGLEIGDKSHYSKIMIRTRNYNMFFTKMSNGDPDFLEKMYIMKRYINNIILIDNIGKRYNIVDLLNKVQVLGVDNNFDFLGIQINTIVQLTYKKTYDYLIRFKTY